jgi:hypothetical protein
MISTTGAGRDVQASADMMVTFVPFLGFLLVLKNLLQFR